MEKASRPRLIDQTFRLVERGTPAMARAALYVAQNPAKVVQSSIAETGRESGAGQSTVIRLCQTLGFDGFRSFKLALAREIEREQVLHLSGEREHHPTVSDPHLTRIASELITTVRGSVGRIDPALVLDLVRCLRQAPSVVAFGIGVSGICAELLAARLVFQKIMIHVPRSGVLARAAAMTLGEDDVAIGISYNGLSEDTVAMLEQARRRGSRTFAITTQPDSPLGHAAGACIEMSVFGPWPKDGSARLLPSMSLLTEYAALLLEKESG